METETPLTRIDEIDRQILSILLQAASTPKAEIARKVSLAPSAVSERIKRLEASGVIKAYETRLDGEQLNAPLLAFVFVGELKPNSKFDTAAALSRVTGVEDVHKIAGEDCFLLKVRTSGTAELATLLDSEINVIPTVASVRTTIVLKTIAERPPLSGRLMFKKSPIRRAKKRRKP